MKPDLVSRVYLWQQDSICGMSHNDTQCVLTVKANSYFQFALGQICTHNILTTISAPLSVRGHVPHLLTTKHTEKKSSWCTETAVNGDTNVCESLSIDVIHCSFEMHTG